MSSITVRLIYTIFFIGAIISITTEQALSQAVLDELPERKGVSIDEHTGEFIPLDLEFVNDAGQTVTLGDYFNKGKPVLLTLVYYNCPMLCTLVLNGVSDGVRSLDWLPGNEFQMLTISIDPRETTELASAKKHRYIETLGKPGTDDGWIFFTGEEEQSRTLADNIGFNYYYDKEKDIYAHAAAAFILTEKGKISRYLYGIQFNERDIRFALLEASKGKIGNTLDKIILFCYHYDPDSQGYVLFAANIMRLGGILTVILLAIVIGTLWKRERTRNSALSTG